MYLLGVDTGGTKTRCIVLDEALIGSVTNLYPSAEQR